MLAIKIICIFKFHFVLEILKNRNHGVIKEQDEEGQCYNQYFIKAR